MGKLETRQKILYGALGLIVVLYGLDAAYRRFYEEPLAAAEMRTARLIKQRDKLRVEVAEGKRTVRLLNEIRKQSLPRDLELARSSYQNWLLQLSQSAELRQIGVDASEPARRASKGQVLYHSIQFTVRGRGSMNQVTKWLYEFYDAGYLHKIRNLTLSPILGTEQVNVSATIEAIVLQKATETQSLPLEAPSNVAFSAPDAYSKIARRDLFSIGGGGRPGRHIRLNAITTGVRGFKEAWFANLRTGQTVRLRTGDELSGLPFQALIAEVEDEYVMLNVEGESWRVDAGLTLSEATVLTE
ncbi:MAG: hypothetical protein AAF497_02915 [Planctomycetota bacterium]